jgi:hypothetical protein
LGGIRRACEIPWCITASPGASPSGRATGSSNSAPGGGGWTKPVDADAQKQGLRAVHLYDLGNDTAVTRNVQAEYREVVERLTKLLEQQITAGGSTPKCDRPTTVPLSSRSATGDIDPPNAPATAYFRDARTGPYPFFGFPSSSN